MANGRVRIRWTSDLPSLARDKSVRQFLEELSDAWEGRLTGGDHIMLRHTSGQTTTLPGSPGDRHGNSLHNARAAIRRIERAPNSGPRPA